jgi:surface carbohydrate biosynthesis protein (TIGR04326 family)
MRLLVTSTNERISGDYKYSNLLWDSYEEGDRLISLPALVESNREEIRKEILSWVFESGQVFMRAQQSRKKNFQKDKVNDWWFSKISLKDPWDSEEFGLAVKLLAVEKFLIDTHPDTIEIKVRDAKIRLALSQLSAALGIKVILSSTVSLRADGKFALRSLSLFRLFLSCVRSFFGFALFLKGRWNLREKNRFRSEEKSKELVLCNYFVNFDTVSDKTSDPFFHSSYWGDVPRLFREDGWKINWLHIFMINNNVGSAAESVKYARTLNQNFGVDETHTFLESALSWRVVFKTLSDVARSWIETFRILKSPKIFPVLGQHINANYLFFEECRKGFFSTNFFVNTLRSHLFEDYFRYLSDQRLLLYLCENQSWEKTLVHSWRNRFKNPIVGVFHFVPKFWDLRLYNDSRANAAHARWDHLTPDFWAVNSPGMLEMQKNLGVSPGRMLPVEAVRYQVGAKADIRRESRSPRKKILILTDFRESVSDQMLSLIKSVNHSTLRQFDWSIKFHSNFELSHQELSFPVECRITSEPLESELKNTDIALVSSDTSAGVDAAIAGCTILIIRDPTSLNYSPMSKDSEVGFIDSALELEKKIQTKLGAYRWKNKNPYVFLDPDLTKWKDLISRFSQ